MKPTLLLLLSLALAGCAGIRASDDVSFVVVRHAEKTSDTERDPDLSVAGRMRAQQLAGLLAGRDLVAVYATEYKRTQQTARPGADAHRLPVTVYAAKSPAAEFAARLKAAHRRGTVLVVGHSNTVPGIVSALCDCDAAPMPESEYDRVSTVRIGADGKPALETGRYGDAAPASATIAYGAPFTLAAGQSVALPDRSALRYAGTINDSRCPPDAHCIWAGDAEARFEWRAQGSNDAETFSLHTHQGERSHMLAGRTLALESLANGDAPAVTLKIE